jgi:Family of unknown function (DUF6338)
VQQFANIETLLVIAIAIVPGYMTQLFYRLRCPAVKVESEKNLSEYLAYSLINLVFWSPLLLSYSTRPREQWVEWQSILIGVGMFFVSPFILANICYYLRSKVFHRRFGWDHPIPRGWDYFVMNNREFCVLFHLKDGKLLGGYFGANSYASTYPQQPEMYVEQVWRVDEFGKFIEMVPGSLGMVINECVRVEFLAVQHQEVNNGQSQQRDTGSKREVSALAGGAGGSGATRPDAPTTTSPDYSTPRGIGDSPAQQPTETQTVRY